MTDAFPEALNAFIGTDAPGGYVVNELFELMAPLAMVAFAVTGGAAAIAGEEQRGTMGMLIAQPLSRRHVLTSKALSVLATLVLPSPCFGPRLQSPFRSLTSS
ncbi:ABC transporter permease subunit [Ornithinimicrobium sp. INDO-MA30-4]|uniref:ABC transporter permease subunit n=1 Tax=Ornithinimicrobium sp. INDO-MA30-4 TaxID=2908651 RepID=UPI001F4889C6|nr:ABC transporter permease subunit [Ornithinimicrobium sp. INDO-MA30-4]UJH70361.1 ABC transporter permease [Ornithinimicrobium sp. INDO-MA30-4]